MQDFAGTTWDFAGGGQDFAGGVWDFAGKGRVFAEAVQDFAGGIRDFAGGVRHITGTSWDFAGEDQDFTGTDRDFAGAVRDFAKNSSLLPGGFLETGEAVLQRLHFREREQERQRGFAALILTQPVHMQPVAAAASGRVVEREAQIVPAQEPLERAPRLRHPERIARRLIRLDAGGNRDLRLDGLLVEDGAFPAA